MAKTIALSVLKFAALTVWIGFVAMYAENLFRPSVFDQLNMVEECRRKATQQNNIDYAGGDYFFRDGGQKTVVVTALDPKQRSTLCAFNFQKEFLYLLR
jgi:hypothetical protein